METVVATEEEVVVAIEVILEVEAEVAAGSIVVKNMILIK
jgi:hypothetical protein